MHIFSGSQGEQKIFIFISVNGIVRCVLDYHRMMLLMQFAFSA